MNNKKKVIPFSVPNVGAGQQLPFDITQAERQVCKECKSEFFDKVYRLGMISRFASGNTTNQEIKVEYPTYVCRECGWEMGKEGEKKK